MPDVLFNHYFHFLLNSWPNRNFA